MATSLRYFNLVLQNQLSDLGEIFDLFKSFWLLYSSHLVPQVQRKMGKEGVFIRNKVVPEGWFLKAIPCSFPYVQYNTKY